MVEKRKMDIILIGDSQVGKTSMLKQFDKKQFNKEAISTIGVDYINRKFKPKADPEKEINVKVWDTAGQDRFRNLTYQMYRQADGIIIVFDKTKKDTFAGVRQWIQSIYKNAKPSLPLILVGNKKDLIEEM